METEQSIFAFELDFAGTSRCIPMVVRFKLDQAGIKLTLRQRSRFERDERQTLVWSPCETEPEVSAYRRHVVDLITLRADEPPVDMAVDPAPAWSATDHVPEGLVRYARDLGLAPPSLEQWKASRRCSGSRSSS